MKRPRLFANKKRSTKSSFATPMSARVIALFLCFGFVFSLAITSYAPIAFAAERTVTPKPLSVEEPATAPLEGALSSGTTLNGPNPGQAQKKGEKKEVTSKRTATTKTFDNGDGTSEVHSYMDVVHYKVNGTWQNIDSTLIEDTNAADSQNIVGEAISWIKGKTQDIHTYKVRANDWQARFAPSDDSVGMVRIEADGKKVSFTPKGANSVKPKILKLDGIEYVQYKNLWDGVDVEYNLTGSKVKEAIVITKKQAKTSFEFKVDGASLTKNSEGGFDISNSQQTLSPLTVQANKSGIIDLPVIEQQFIGDTLQVKLDSKWLQAQQAENYPVVIDPSWSRATSRVSWNYTAYKSNGYVCSSSSCFMNAGYLYDGGWKGWRSVFRIDFNVLQGKQLLDASFHVQKAMRSFYTGTNEGLYTEMSHATCWGYNCIDFNAPRHSAWYGTSGDINFTALMQSRMNVGDWGACFILNGEERAYTTYKGLDADNSYFVLSYNSGPGMTTPVTPANGQVTVTDQPLLQVNAVGDPDGDAPQYYYRIATNPDAETGTVINSGWLTGQTSFTIPEGRLQDGVTYYWHVYTYDGYWQTNPNWVRSFKYDARLGSDSAASFDDGGPVDVNLATGNVTTSFSSHSTSTLGGNIGVSASYNSPYRSKPGLVAQYFNNTAYSGVALERIETNLNFPWGTASPAPGVVSQDNFSTRMTGYFVAPKKATYQFGFTADDNYAFYLNNEATAATSSGCCAQGNWTMAPRIFEEGQVIPFRIDFSEATGLAYLHAAVRIDGVEQQIQPQWLRTAPRPTFESGGLSGKYYYDSGTHVFPTDDFSSFLQRREKNMNFAWGAGSPVVYGPTDKFLARYTGYFTAPVSGTYQFGTDSDDGSRIFLNGSTTPYMNDWVDSGNNRVYGGNVSLAAGQSIPITVEYFENVGSATFALLVKGVVAEQVVSGTWLSTKISPLPAGWQMSADPDGDLAYDYALIQAQSVILYDADGEQHAYTWTGSAYKPPVNEYGTLTRNSNGTLTLIDSDGRTYTFDSAGRITTVTSPVDDRKPTAIQYKYGVSADTTNGYITRLTEIDDGVDSARWGKLYYAGDSQCPEAPSGYTTAPYNMLCAFKTYDGRITSFFYINSRLARVVSNGGEATTFGYDANGLMTSQQSSTAYDAISAAVRADDDTTKTMISYDVLGRAADITMPSATQNAFRAIHKYIYLNNATQTKEVGETEPKGYSSRVEYDSLYRTTKSFDKLGLATTQEWDATKDLLLSSTDATGLKSTTLYDKNDMPTETYGPAPAAWFGADRAPAAAYASQVPRISTAYDESIDGLAVSWFDFDAANGGALVGAPKLHTTGFDTSKPDQFWLDSNNSPAKFPYSRAETGVQGVGFRATGKLVAETGGSYSVMACYDDAMKVSLNDEVIINDWGYRGNAVKCTTAPARTLVKGSSNRITVDYANATGTYYAFSLNSITTDATSSSMWGTKLKPDYGLQTSQTVYSAPTSAGATANIKSTTNYGSTPELGLAQSVTTDAGGVAPLTASSTYEVRGAANSYLRQTSSSLPGGATTNYEYYGATQIVADPCDSSKSYRQGGMLRLKTEPDPDGSGPQQARTVETVYDDAGKVAATRYNDDSWTCTTYDSRERVISTIVPAYNNHASRTITNNYAAGGNPLVTASTDSSGTITVENDLLGRNVRYTDAKNNVTTSEYDNAGHLAKRTSPIGIETYVYDDYDRLIDQKLDGQVLAHVTYDEFSRITNIQYQSGLKLDLSRESTTSGLGRLIGRTYTTATGQILADTVSRAVTGDITGGTELGQAKSYSYDTAGRLVAATVAGNTFTYGYGSQSATCTGLPGVASDLALAGKDSNRTSQTINGVATTYCYDQADRLVASSNPLYDKPVYDTHGNTTSMGDGANGGAVTAFTYDSSDRNIGIEQTNAQGVTKTNYARDVQGRLLYRHFETSGSNVSDDYYGYTAAGDSPDFITDVSGNVTEKYMTLPGDVLITVRPNRSSAGARTYSLPNNHGDVFATVDADGLVKSLSQTGPFGEVLGTSTVNTATPWNTLNGASFTYVGQHEKLTESALALTPIQMGARVYIPGLGRFLSVDPVQGGTPNNYVYATDGVNEYDLTGEFIPLLAIAIYAGFLAWSAYDYHRDPSPTNMAFLVVSVVPGSGSLKAGGKIVQGASKLGKAGKLGRNSATTTRAVRSINQVNKDIQKGRAPSSMVRADRGKIKGEQNHIHFKNNHALNQNGTWKHGGRKLTNKEKAYLKKIGWKR